ncbi:MAG: ATP-binding cassette domain-containing protein, partial [Eubacteriales bacterium]|nr:ATP-binding cassette domain-containing protein [Eubacteriales bacterium]
MEMMTLEQFTFTYPGQETPALRDINLLIRPAELTVVCGPSGCGKTTLVRSMKREIAPYGQTSGRIFFRDHELLEGPPQSRAGDIGVVMQDPDHQIVTDTVWHELAFGLE